MRILIFNHRHMGDVLMTTPALIALRNKFKDSEIDCVTNKIGREVLKEQGLVDKIILEEEKGEVLKRRIYDLAILFKATLRNSIDSRLLGIPKRIGWNREWNSFLLTHSIKTKSQHCIHQNIDLLKPLGIENISDQMLYKIPPQTNNNLITGDYADYIVINPGATTPSNRWPSEYFAKLANLIQEKFPCSVVITGNQSDAQTAEIIIAPVNDKNRIISLAGKTSIPELANILKNAKAIITGDTGPMHLAIAVKTPIVIAIFGPANEKLTGPLPEHGTILAKDKAGNWRDGNPEFKNVPVDLIKPEEVFEALSTRLKI